MYSYHALPDRWYEMDYHQFLAERQKRLAAIIREGFARLGSESNAGLLARPLTQER